MKIFQTAMHDEEIAVGDHLAWPAEGPLLFWLLFWSSFVIDDNGTESPVESILVKMVHLNIVARRAVAILIKRAVSIFVNVPNTNGIRIFPVWNSVWKFGSKIVRATAAGTQCKD